MGFIVPPSVYSYLHSKTTLNAATGSSLSKPQPDSEDAAHFKPAGHLDANRDIALGLRMQRKELPPFFWF